MGRGLPKVLPIIVATGLAWGPALAQEATALRPPLDAGDDIEFIAAADPADALAPDPSEPVRTRLTVNPPAPEPPRRARRQPDEAPYAPLGLRTGGLTFYPEWETGVVVTDNVGQTGSDRKTAVGLALRPALRVASDWPRHRLAIVASGEKVFYRDFPEFNDAAANANAVLSLDVRRSTRLDLGATYALAETGPSSFDVPDAAIGRRRDHTVGVSAALSHTFNRLTATARGGARWAFFDDVELAGGGEEDNGDREYVSPRAGLRLAYELSPALTPFVDVEYAPRFYHRKPDRNGFDRDSHGITVLAGTTVNGSAVWDGEIALRYDYRDYEDPALNTVGSIGAEVRINWRPSRLTTVNLTASSGIDEAFLSGSNGVRNHDVSLDIRHALRDNVELNAGASYGIDDFVGTSADDDTFVARLGLGYELNRNAELVAGYEFTRFDSGAPGADYREHLFTTGLRFRL